VPASASGDHKHPAILPEAVALLSTLMWAYSGERFVEKQGVLTEKSPHWTLLDRPGLFTPFKSPRNRPADPWQGVWNVLPGSGSRKYRA
jgi:hypothetical protein